MNGTLILGIETSCDETSAAVLRNGHEVLSNVVASQLIHADYGGVVPELASREHLRAIVPVVREALQRAHCTYADLDAIAVTSGPGLAGALLVGIAFAKSLAFALNKPLIAVNHLEGHIHAVLMETHALGAPGPDSRTREGPSPILPFPTDLSSRPDPELVEGGVERPAFPEAAPLLALVVSGGHTHLYLATRTPHHTWHYRNVGKTLDDAAGEAYDKVAKLLGLPYPGGPWMDALAAHGTPDPNLFPYTQIKAKATGNTAPKLEKELAAAREAGLKPAREAGLAAGFSPLNHDPQNTGALAPASLRFDLSFSGIKTAVRRYVELHNLQPSIATRIAALGAPGPASGTRVLEALPLFDTQTLNLIASFQHAVVKNLTRATFQAAEHFAAGGILVSGGVSANTALRATMTAAAARAKLPIAFPTVALSTDNAAMIAAAAWPKYLTQDFAPSTLEPTPQLRLG